MDIESERDCYGCTVAQLRVMLHETSLEPCMLAMSMLSDAQECIAHGMNENARRLINQAKFVISEKLATENDVTQTGQRCCEGATSPES